MSIFRGRLRLSWKRKWSVPGQDHADPGALFVGNSELNYSSTKEHIEVEAASKTRGGVDRLYQWTRREPGQSTGQCWQSRL